MKPRDLKLDAEILSQKIALNLRNEFMQNMKVKNSSMTINS